MEERKCFGCRNFGHVAHYCRNVGEERLIQMSSNRFKVLKVRIMQRGEGSGKEVAKDRKEILREEKAKREVEVRQTKIEKKEKKEKMLREVVVKIRLKQDVKIEKSRLSLFLFFFLISIFFLILFLFSIFRT